MTEIEIETDTEIMTGIERELETRRSMKLKKKVLANQHFTITVSFLKWLLFGGIIGIVTGSSSAIFLKALGFVTDVRLANPWLLFLLPFGGAAVSYLYMKIGKNSIKGTNLIIESVQGEPDRIPLRMAPLVLFGTLVTHLFGGSVGREGTAVQMGGSLAEWVGKTFKLEGIDRRILLMCGISGGFGAVFGTPIAGAIFGMEVISIGWLGYRALIPCFSASIVGHLLATKIWGIQHIHFQIGQIPSITGMVLLKIVLASILFGLTSFGFSKLLFLLRKWFSQLFHNPVIKTAVGGCIIIGLVYIVGSRDYLGLSLPLIEDSFQEDSTISPFSFVWKMIFTAVTLGSGFQGGEVTPLFVMGANLGHILAGLLGLSVPFLSALGLIAVFSGATNTPIASVFLGIELFGSEGAIFMFIACIVSYIFSGYSGVYTSQRIRTSKSGLNLIPADATLVTWKSRVKRVRRR